MSEIDIKPYLRRGDSIMVGQAAAEPLGLIRALMRAATETDGLSAFAGYSFAPEWEKAVDGRIAVRSYAAHAGLRPLSRAGRLEVVPEHLSAIESHLREGRLRADVVLLQVGALEADGHYGLGPTVDHVWAAAQQARVVLVEVNPYLPRALSSRKLPESLVTAAYATNRRPPASPARAASETERLVAVNVAELIPSGATIQLGVGALADEVASALHERRDLQVRSGLAGDWLVDLYEAGAMRGGTRSAVLSMAVGSNKLYDFVDDHEAVWFAAQTELLDPAALRCCDPYVSVNSAVEVGLTGEINSEVVGGKYVGAVGGQVDFFRATRLAPRGLAVVALGARHPSGGSRIVRRIDGPATSLKSDVDVVVTEWGVADLRGASLRERAARLRAIAAPEHRHALDE